MTILHPITDLLFDLFPEANGERKALVDAMRRFYTTGGVEPNVTVQDDMVQVVLDVESAKEEQRTYQKAVADCEAGEYAKARTLLEDLITRRPAHSEYHRLLGQVVAELGEPEAAIDHLIDALRWDPKNTHALIMMGNLQAKHRADIDTAMRYYEAALAVDPKDHLAANNIAAQFLQLGQWDKAEDWFEKAISIRPDYPNSHHGAAIVAERKGDLDSALFAATEALRNNPKQDELYRQSLALARHAAHELVGRDLGRTVVRRLSEELHQSSGRPVRSVADDSIPTAARLEVAEVYHRPDHVVRYKPGYPCVEHL
ncbi:MAG: tetratricopeptide repeat protein, partial [Flavobacteriales bacterium]|nr:tetratricopeptide repeat protein [Flavobacteriales bacterium]